MTKKTNERGQGGTSNRKPWDQNKVTKDRYQGSANRDKSFLKSSAPNIEAAIHKISHGKEEISQNNRANNLGGTRVVTGPEDTNYFVLK